MVGNTILYFERLIIMEKEYKKVSFRLDANTYNDLCKQAEYQYLSVSAYIRKFLEKELYKERYQNELQRYTTST